MISDAAIPELPIFRRAESLSKFEIAHAFQDLVVAGSNDRMPVHRWFRFKESFSADLLGTVLREFVPRHRHLRLLDPFCGVGTSLVAAQELTGQGIPVTATGIERNPFIAFVARTKTSWPRMDQQVLRSLPLGVLNDTSADASALPQNSSFLTSRCMSHHKARRLLEVAAAIRRDGSSATHDALLLGLAAAIEPLSRTRKDGRALRLVQKPKTTVAAVLKSRWDAILEDVSLLQRSLSAGVPDVLLGDGRRPSDLGVECGSMDLVLTSPPYPNNIDYTEVYKLELWLLGFVATAQQFLQLRRATFRSHPTCGLEPPDPDFMAAVRRGHLKSLLAPILSHIEELREPWRKRVVLGYFSDIWTSLSESRRLLRDEGRAVYIVGNSLHGGADKPYLVPTDLLVAAIAERVGLKVERTVAARALKRRLSGNHFLRESLVVMRKARG